MAPPPDLFALALQYHRAGDVPQAEMLYRQLLQAYPGHADALHLLGVLYHQTGRSELAIDYISQAIQIMPNFAEAHNNLANVYVGLGRLAEAEAHSRNALRLKPDFADAYNNLGIVQRQQGQLDQAVASYRQALKYQPNNPFALNNLGNVLREQGKLDEAIACYDQALRVNPDFAEAHNNKGTAFQDQGKVQLAQTCFREALRRRSAYPDALNNLGVVLANSGNNAEARVCYEQAVRLAPRFAAVRKNLGLLCHTEGKLEEAASHFKEVLQLSPQDATAQHLLAAITGVAAPAIPSPDYVASLFDCYSGHFDEHLRNSLKYRGPELLREAVAFLKRPKALDILDLGCGTGLCGAAFQDLAKTLTGVDLSPKMLAKANQRGIYSQLIQGDILVPLAASKAAYDLILAADVFTYMGDLSQAFNAIAGALRRGGHLAYWVEAHETDGDTNFVLRTSGRYGHSLGYLRSLAESTRLSEVSLQKAVARIDRDQAIDSFVVVLRAS